MMTKNDLQAIAIILLAIGGILAAITNFNQNKDIEVLTDRLETLETEIYLQEVLENALYD